MSEETVWAKNSAVRCYVVFSFEVKVTWESRIRPRSFHLSLTAFFPIKPFERPQSCSTPFSRRAIRTLPIIMLTRIFVADPTVRIKSKEHFPPVSRCITNNLCCGKPLALLCNLRLIDSFALNPSIIGRRSCALPFCTRSGSFGY